MTTTTTTTSPATRRSDPGRRIVPLVGDEPAMRDWADELVERARTEGVELTGDDGLLTALVRQVLQTGLEVEMTDHLGYDRHAVAGRGRVTAATVSYPKTVTTEIGQVGLRVPAGPQRQLRPGHGAQGATPPGWAHRQRDLALRQGHDHRRHPGAPGGDLRHRDLAGHDQPDHRRHRRGHGGLAEPAAGPGLPGDVDRRHRGQDPRRAGRQPADLRGHGRQPRR